MKKFVVMKSAKLLNVKAIKISFFHIKVILLKSVISICEKETRLLCFGWRITFSCFCAVTY